MADSPTLSTVVRKEDGRHTIGVNYLQRDPVEIADGPGENVTLRLMGDGPGADMYLRAAKALTQQEAMALGVCLMTFGRSGELPIPSALDLANELLASESYKDVQA